MGIYKMAILWGKSLFLISMMALSNITYLWYVAGCTVVTQGNSSFLNVTHLCIVYKPQFIL